MTEIHLVTRGEMKEGRQAVREREWLRRLPPTVAGARIYLDAGCRDPHEAAVAWEAASAAALALQELGGLPVMSRSQDAIAPRAGPGPCGPTVMGSDLIVAFQMNPDGDDSVFFFAIRAQPVRRRARCWPDRSPRSLGGKVEGRASALLKDTSAPAVVVSRAKLDERSRSCRR